MLHCQQEETPRVRAPAPNTVPGCRIKMVSPASHCSKQQVSPATDSQTFQRCDRRRLRIGNSGVYLFALVNTMEEECLCY